MASILDTILAQQGQGTQDKLSQDIQGAVSRAVGGLSNKVTRVGTQAERYQADPYKSLEVSNAQSSFEAASNMRANAERWTEEDRPLLNYNNLNSTNPFVRIPANIANLGAAAAGELTGGVLNLFSLNSGATPTIEASSIPAEIRDAYVKQQRGTKHLDDLNGVKNLLESQGVEALVGHDKRFKTLTELNNHISNAEAKAKEDEVSPDVLSTLNSTNGYLRSKYNRDVTWKEHIDQLQERFKAEENFYGNTDKGIDNVLKTRKWKNQYGVETHAADFEAANTDNAALDKQGRQKRKDADGFMEWLSGAGDTARATIGSAGTAIKTGNAQFLAETAAELVPQLAQRTWKASLGGDFARVLREGTYAEKEGEKGVVLPTIADSIRATTAATAYTGLNYAERALSLGALKGRLPTAEGMSRAAGNAVEGAVAGASRAMPSPLAAAVNALPTNIAGRTAATAGLAGLSEGVIEGAQEYTEGLAKGDTTFDAAKVGQAAGIGIMMGAGMGTVGGVRAGITDRSSANVTDKISKTYGDPNIGTDDLADPDSTAYNPTQAANRVVTEAFKSKDPDVINTAQESLNSYRDTLEQATTALEERIKLASDPEAIAVIEARIEKGTAVLEAHMQSDPTDPTFALKQKYYETMLDGLKQQIAPFKSEEYSIEEDNARLQSMNEQAIELQKVADSFASKVKTASSVSGKAKDKDSNDTDDSNSGSTAKQDSKENTKEETATEQDVESANTKETKQAATPDEEAGIFLAAPSKDNLADIERLSLDENVSEPLRIALRKVHEAITAENAKKSEQDVSSQVTNGADGYRGSAEYISTMHSLVEAGDITGQSALMRQINTFEQSRTNKLNALYEAQEKANTTGKKQQIAKNADITTWHVPEKPYNYATKRSNNALDVHPERGDKGGTAKLQAALNADIRSIVKTREAMEALRSMKGEQATEQANMDVDPFTEEATAQAVEEQLQQEEAQAQQQQMDDSYNAEQAEPVQQQVYEDDAQMQQPPMEEFPDQYQEMGDVDNADYDIGLGGDINLDPSKESALQAEYDEMANNTDMQEMYEADQQISEQLSEDNESSKDGLTGGNSTSTKEGSKPKSKYGKDAKQGGKTKETASKETTNKTDEEPKVKSGEKTTATKRKRVVSSKRFDTAAEARQYKADSENGDKYLFLKRNDGKYSLVHIAKVFPFNPMDAANKYNTVAEETIPADVEVYDDQTLATDVPSLDSAIVNDNAQEATMDSTEAATYTPTIEVLNREDYAKELAEEKAKPIREQNMFFTGFMQRIKEGTNSALTSVAQLFETEGTVRQDAIRKTIVEQTGEEATQEQLALVSHFDMIMRNGLGSDIQFSMKKEKDTSYHYKRFANFVMDDTGGLDTAVTTALGVSIYSWLAENGDYTVSDRRQVAKILHLKEKDLIAPRAYAMVADVGVHQQTLAASLGQRAMQTLQLSMLDDVSPARLHMLEQTLGTIAVGVMVDKGLAERTALKVSDIKNAVLSVDTNSRSQLAAVDRAASKTDVMAQNEDGLIYFIRPSQNAKLPKKVASLAKGTQGVLSKLFGYTPASVPVSLAPAKSTPNKFGRFSSTLPKDIKKAIHSYQSTAYRLDEPVVAFTKRLIEGNEAENNAIHKMLGWKDTENVHAAFREENMSINLGIERSLNNLYDTSELVDGKDFYLQSVVWPNMRMGIINNFNPQADKLHRGFSSLANDYITVPTTSDPFKEDGSLSEYGMFLRAVGFRIEDFKIDGMAVDKEELTNFIPAMHDYVNSSEVKNAAMAMDRIMVGIENKGDLDKVAELLGKWDMGSLGISALNSLRAMHVAKSNNEKSFNANIPADSDGLVNGPATTGILMMHSAPAFYESVGIIPFAKEGSTQIESMQQWRKVSGNKDPYEVLGEAQLSAWESEYLVNDDALVYATSNALQRLDDDYGTRKGAKRALTPFNYGSELASINKSNARETLTAVYKKIDKLDSYPKLQDDINQLIEFANANGMKVAKVTRSMLANREQLLPLSVELAITTADIELRGGATSKAIDATLGEYRELRAVYTSLSNNAFSAFNTLYKLKLDEAIEAKRKRIKESDGVGKDQMLTLRNGVDVENLTKKELDEVFKSVRNYLPVAPTVSGMVSGDAQNSGIAFADKSKEWNSDFIAEVAFNNAFGGKLTDKSVQAKGGVKSSTTLKSGLRSNAYIEPGVQALALFVQSHDAYVTYMVGEAMKVQNYHDANSGNAYSLNDMAKVQNEAYLDAITTSHIGYGFSRALITAMQGVTANASSLPVAAIQELNTNIASIAKQMGISSKGKTNAMLLKAIVSRLVGRDVKKMRFLGEQKAIAQYATEGGSYEITPAKRTQIGKRTEKLKDELYPQLLRSIDDMAHILNAVTQAPTSIDTASGKGNLRTVLNELGESAASKELLDTLRMHIRNDGSNKKHLVGYNALLDVADKVIKETGTEVNLIDNLALSNKAGASKAIQEGTNAWYTTEGKRPSINIVVDRNMDAQTVMHEVVHALTAIAVKAARSNPSKYPEASKAVERIDAVRERFKATLNEASPPTFHYAAKNIDEFMAEGLTNPAVIAALDSIVDVPLGDRTTKGIGTLFRSFITNVLNALFSMAKKGTPIQTITAYEALVIDTAHLMDANVNASADNSIYMGAPRKKAVDDASKFTAAETLQTLSKGDNSESHTDKLSRIARDLIDPIYSASDKVFLDTRGEYTPDTLWNATLTSGKAAHTTAALRAGYKLSEQEQMIVEALEISLQAATKGASTREAYGAMERAFTSAKNKLTPVDFLEGDWDSASTEAKEIAQSKYDHIFKQSGHDYITRFMALTIGSEEVSGMMDMAIDPKVLIDSASKGGNKLEKLVDAANRLTNYVANVVTSNATQGSIVTATESLAKQLAMHHLKSKNKATNILEQGYTSTLNALDTGTVKLRKAVSSAITSSPISMFDNRYTNTIKNAMGIADKTGNAMHVMDSVTDFRNSEHPNSKLGFLGELVSELSVNNKSQKVANEYLSIAKQNESIANRLRTTTASNLRNFFSTEVNKKESAQITNVMLRTDLQSLLSTYSFTELADIVGNNTKIESAISKEEAVVKDQVMINRAKDLAWYMLGNGGSDTLAKNAMLIASNAGINYKQSEDVALVESIDRLVSLYALKYTADADKKAVRALIKSEESNKEGNGFGKLLNFHSNVAAQSFEELFYANPLSYTKGYLPSITNPNKEVVVANTPADIKKYKDAMYVEVGTVKGSAYDPNKGNGIMFMAEDAVNQKYVTGAMAIQNTNRKGTRIDMTRTQMVAVSRKAAEALSVDASYDPRYKKYTSSAAIPTYDTEGYVIGYNYEMKGDIADRYLGRKNNFDEVLGELQTQVEVKGSNTTQNLNLADALIDHYHDSYSAVNKDEWVYVGEGVSDPQLAESWALMPKDIKNHIHERTGRRGLYVNNRAYLAIFGSRKLTSTSMFDKDLKDRNVAEELYIGMMQLFFGNNARVRNARGERVWQEGVKLLKDIVVIRNMSTAVMNMVSNAMLLLAHGIPPNDVVKHSLEAVRAGGEYRRLATQLVTLQNKQRAGDTSAKTVDEIHRVSNRIAKNPLIDLINAGMFSGIVEDIDTGSDSYSYSDELKRKYADKINAIPSSIRTAAATLVVSPSTPLYKFLYASTQYGDFAAKYAMYKYYTEKAKDKLSHADAINIANDNFINYDVPTSKGMQYANDMGLVMFTKYNIRIQKALFEIIGKKPATALGQAMAVDALNQTAIRAGIDPIVFNNIGVPFRGGALGLLGAWDEPLPIAIIKHVYN